jgi:hypothetical protein
MTCTYYEVDIIHTSSSDNGDKFYNNGEETIPFETVEKVKEWLDQKYGSEHTLFKDPNYKIKRSIMYHGDSTPCGYVFEFEDADYSHAPIEKWIQRDWVTINKIVSKNAFKEVKYEVLEN